MQKNDKIAIICYKVMQPSETFVTRHIHELLPGRAVVVCYDNVDVDNLGFPVLCAPRCKRTTLPPPLRKTHRALRFFLQGSTDPPGQKEFQQVGRFFKEHRVKAVLAEFGSVAVRIQPFAVKMGIPLFVIFQGIGASKHLNDWRMRYAYRKLLPKAEGIICVSRALRENLRSIGFTHPNTHIIPSGVDVDFFEPAKAGDSDMVLAVGRFVEKKAPHHTIEAFASAASAHPFARLEMIGEGELLPRCRKLAYKLGLAEKVVFHGVREHEFVQRKMSEAAMFVQHSVTAVNGDMEGLPTGIQEAMACALPVVSTRHSGIPEAVIHGETGFLVEEHDVEGMGRAMDKLLGDPELRENLGKAGRRRAEEHFSAIKLLDKLRGVMGLKE